MLDRDRYSYCLDQAAEASTSGRLEDALAWLDEAMRADPSGSEAHNTRGELLWDNGRAEEALHEFVCAIEMSPEQFQPRLNQIDLLIEAFEEIEEALDLADELLTHRLDRGVEAEVYYLKSKALFYLDDLDGALFLLRRAIQTDGETSV